MDPNDPNKYRDLPEQNSRLAINQLAPELLIRIFQMNAYRGYVPYCCRRDEQIATHMPVQLRDTINASHVCLRWRNTVIAAPELWKIFIDLTHPREEWTELLLERSEPHAITMMHPHFDPTQYQKIALARRANELRSRLLQYRVRIRSDDNDYEWPTEPDAWPRLDFLCIDANTQSWSSVKVLPEGIPGIATPHLRHLHLHCCIFPDTSQLLPMANTLIHLTVEGISHQQIPTIGQWVDVIPKLYNLKTLILKEGLRGMSKDAESGTLLFEKLSRQKVALGLEEFFFEDELPTCAQMLSCFTFPHLRSLRIRCSSSSPGPEMDMIISSLSSNFVSMSNRCLFDTPALQLQDCRVKCMGLATSFDSAQSPFEPDYPPEDVGAVIDVTLTIASESPEKDPWNFFFHPLLNVLNLASDRITLLSIDDPDLFKRIASADDFLSRCDFLHRIESVTLDVWKLLYTQLIAKTMAQESEYNHQPGTFLPALKEIALSINDRKPLNHPLYDELINLCSYRRKMGSPLQKLLYPPYRDLLEGSDLFLLDLVARLNPLGVDVVF